MREYTIEQSSLNCRWTYERMLPSLPNPGSAAFASLCKGLHSYGISPSGVFAEAPSSRLSDVNIGISLIDNRVILRFTAGWFELNVNNLFDTDEEGLIGIADQVFIALKLIDGDTTNGSMRVRLSSHLKLPPLEASTFLEEHFRLHETIPGLIPDAAAYKVNLQQKTKSQELRMVIAKSLIITDGIFIDLTAEYRGTAAPVQFAEWINSDFKETTELLGLKPKTIEEGKKAL